MRNISRCPGVPMDRSQPIDKHSIEQGVEAFVQSMSDLSTRHYGLSGSELLEGLGGDDLARKQYARLLGVMVKQPFTVEVKRKKSKRTHSLIALRWEGESQAGTRATIVSLPQKSANTWQAKFLMAIAKDERPQSSDQDALNALLIAARYESRLGEHIFAAFRRYLCDGGPNARAIKEAIGEARKKAPNKLKKKARIKRTQIAGLKASDLTVNGMKFQAASLIAASVAHVLPNAIAIYAFPLIGGVAFMLLQVGLEGFCGWSAEMEKTSQLRQSEEEDKVT